MAKDNGPLVPTPVTDKNGRRTTVHKRQLRPVGNTALTSAPPTLPTLHQDRDAYQPTKRQLTEQHHEIQIHPGRVSPELRNLVERDGALVRIGINASDVQMYSYMAALDSTVDALVLLHADVDGHNSAKAQLERLGLESLASPDPNRSALMQRALEKRIPASAFAEFDLYYWRESDDEVRFGPRYLDAAHAYSIASIKKTSGMVDAVLNGAVRMEDILAVGVSNVQTVRRHKGDASAVDLMQRLSAGKPNCTPEQLGSILAKCDQRATTFAMLNLVDDYGGEFVASLEHAEQAADIKRLCNDDGEPDVRGAIAYADAFRKLRFRNHKQVYDLFRAGVDLDFAVAKSESFEQYSVQQIIAMHAGISQPLTDGHL